MLNAYILPMADTTTTSLAVLIPQLFDMQVLDARYAKAQIMPRFLNKSQLVSKFGNKVNIPIEPKLAGGTVNQTTGEFTPEAWTFTEVELDIDKWDHASVDVIDNAQAQSHTDTLKRLPSAAGKKLAEQVDIALADLHANWTTDPVGSIDNPTIFGDGMILEALFSLSDNDIPKENLSWILSSECYYLGIFTKERWTSADTTGLPKSVLQTNFRFPIFGIPAYETSLVRKVGNIKKCFIGHQEGLATALQVETKAETSRRTSALKLSTVVIVQNQYGIKTVRADHMRVLNVLAGKV